MSMMNLPNDILHNILSYVDLYEDKRIEVFHQIKMNKVLTELKKNNEMNFCDNVVDNLLPYFEYLLDNYTDEDDLQQRINHLPIDIMNIKSYLDEPYKKWNIDCGDYIIITNDFANYVNYTKELDPHIITDLMEMKSNYQYNFIDNNIQDIVDVIING